MTRQSFGFLIMEAGTSLFAGMHPCLTVTFHEWQGVHGVMLAVSTSGGH